MQVRNCVACTEFPCRGVNAERYTVPDADVDPERVKVAMVAEAPPDDPADYFYAEGMPSYLETTMQAFGDAGAPVSSMAEILARGVYITTAVKCGKTGYSVPTKSIEACSHLLEQELALFPNTVAVLAMGDVAIRAMNYVARRQTRKRVIPAGSTYRIRHEPYHLGGVRVFPSYLSTGRSYLIEKSKQRMVAEDIRAALALAG